MSPFVNEPLMVQIYNVLLKKALNLLLFTESGTTRALYYCDMLV